MIVQAQEAVDQAAAQQGAQQDQVSAAQQQVANAKDSLDHPESQENDIGATQPLTYNNPPKQPQAGDYTPKTMTWPPTGIRTHASKPRLRTSDGFHCFMKSYHYTPFLNY